MYDIIVVGGGISGLLCAAYFTRKGRKVLVLEAHDRPGGGLHTFRERGFTFRTGVHYVGHLGRDDQKFLNYCAGYACTRQLESPPEVYPTTTKRCHGVSRGELEQLAGGVWWVCVCKLVVWPLAALIWIYLHLFRREAFGSYFAWMRKRGALPTYKLQSLDWGKGQDAPGMVGAAVALHYAEHRAVDRHLVRRLCSAIRRGGGLLLNHKVRKIESHKVWVGERCFEAPQIISSLGAATCLLAPLPRLQRVAEAIGPSTSHAHLFLGLHCSRESIGMPEGVLWGEGPVFVSAHEGEGLGVSILTPVPPMGDEAWEREKPKWKKFLLGHFLKLFPGAKAEVCSLGGPRASFAYLGRRSSYGLKMCPRRFTWESVRALSPSTEIPGLYLTGQDILLPGFASQIATSMITCRALEGKTLLDTILGRDLLDQIPD